MERIKAFILVVAIMLCASVTAQAQSLMSPLSGNIKNRGLNQAFGVPWSTGITCGGYVKIHNGVDVQAVHGESVYAVFDGYVRAASLDPTWGGWVTLDHGPLHTFLMTTVYWHIIPTVSANTFVAKGQLIGHVADLGSSTHFHLGIRLANYDNTSNSGALPQTNCGGYPAFAASFVNPWNYTFENNPH